MNPETHRSIRSIVVLGGGSAGFIAAVTLKAKLPELDITVLRSPQIGIIGVGEGTTAGVPKHLHSYLGISFSELLRMAKPTWKLGIRFHWGPRSHFNYTFGRQLDARWPELARSNGYYCENDFSNLDVASSLMDAGNAFPIAPDGRPVVPAVAAYHFENESFVEFLEAQAVKLDVKIRDVNVESAEVDEAGVNCVLLDSGEKVAADLFVDASGFRSLLLGQALHTPFKSYRSSLFCDRAVVGGWQREEEPILPYTTADTMQAGWSWQIEHEHRINRGYVYSTSFISDDEAEAEFRKQNPKLGPTRIVEFPSGRYDRFWVKNVVGVGNAAGFVEPLEATSLAAICDEARFLAESLFDCQFRPNDSIRKAFNAAMCGEWDNIRDFLAVHYKFNTRLDTEFWKACRDDVDLADAQGIVEFYKQNGPTLFARQMLLGPHDQFGLEGYFVMLFGQAVPFEANYQPNSEELPKWHARCRNHAEIAAKAMNISSLLRELQVPGWQPHLQPLAPAESGIRAPQSSSPKARTTPYSNTQIIIGA